MRQHILGKQNIRGIVNQKGSIMKLQMANFMPEGDRLLSKNTSRMSISRAKKDDGDLRSSKLQKFIESGSCYDMISRRESIESRVSKISRRQTYEHTQNYTQKLSLLTQNNKRLTDQNRQLRKKIAEMGQRVPPQDLNSFDIMNLLEDSNRVLKKKLKESRNTSPVLCKQAQSSLEISRLYEKAFVNAKMPDLQSLISAIKQYQKCYEDTFIKINFLAENTEASPKHPALKQLRHIVSALRLPIKYKNNPDQLQRSREKPSGDKRVVLSKSKPTRRDNSIVESLAPELLSPQDTLQLLQKLLLKVVNSQAMRVSFTSRSSTVRLFRKICEHM